MFKQINIMALVDVIGALSAGTLTGNIFITDNGSLGACGKGTGTLLSVVTLGQVINWHVVPVDVQTDVAIEKIDFYRNGTRTAKNTPCAQLRKYGAPSGDYWAGIVNPAAKSGLYQYRIALNMERKIVAMEACAYLSIAAFAEMGS